MKVIELIHAGPLTLFSLMRSRWLERAPLPLGWRRARGKRSTIPSSFTPLRKCFPQDDS
ncbi:hypothetical protein KSP40_PGU001285 [Platanthera guangdongensis]|uniref:Uncharacterized protein n=1 Tax=Platanthera guangdongensis TaxID=2320717 RepID=A0ABR2MBN6_9ASPA